MKVEDPPLLEALACRKEAIVGEWRARALRTYPDHTARFLREEPDPFRNPVGQAFKQELPVLFEELTGSMETGRIRRALDGLVRIRAVQDFTPSQAVGFVFLLKEILREQGPVPPELDARIDRLALAAFDLYAECREKIAEIRTAEARRLAGLASPAAAVGSPTTDRPLASVAALDAETEPRPEGTAAPSGGAHQDRAATVRERSMRGNCP